MQICEELTNWISWLDRTTSWWSVSIGSTLFFYCMDISAVDILSQPTQVLYTSAHLDQLDFQTEHDQQILSLHVGYVDPLLPINNCTQKKKKRIKKRNKAKWRSGTIAQCVPRSVKLTTRQMSSALCATFHCCTISRNYFTKWHECHNGWDHVAELEKFFFFFYLEHCNLQSFLVLKFSIFCVFWNFLLTFAVICTSFLSLLHWPQQFWFSEIEFCIIYWDPISYLHI